MNLILAFTVGFLVGNQGGARDRHDVSHSVSTIRDSNEVAAFMMVTRSQVARGLRRVADLLDASGSDAGSGGAPDLVDRVRQLVGR